MSTTIDSHSASREAEKPYDSDRNVSHVGVSASISDSILKTLLYFDIFGYPLRLPEIYQFLPTSTVALADLRLACYSHPLKSRVSVRDEHYFLRERPESCVDDRKLKERRAQRLWLAAKIMSRIIRTFPYVRAVFISGELSKGIASENADVDFFIIAAHNRVWIVRTLCAAFKRVFLFNKRKFFCYNHIVSERRLEVTERNIYTAIETVTLKPMWNKELFEKFLECNSWTNEYLPNWHAKEPGSLEGPSGHPMLERIVEALMSHEALDALDQRLLTKWRQAWMRRYPSLTPAKREELFQCTSDLSTSYVGDFCQRIMHQYNQNLELYGIVPIRTESQPEATEPQRLELLEKR